MAAPQEGGGWPLGLEPVNVVRMGLQPVSNLDFSGSLSISSITSSDLDTQSSVSFFHDKSITLGSLIGITSIVKPDSMRGSRSHKTNTCFSLCPKAQFNSQKVLGSAPLSLGHFLEVERGATSSQWKSLLEKFSSSCWHRLC